MARFVALTALVALAGCKEDPTCEDLLSQECVDLAAYPVRADNCAAVDTPIEALTELGEGVLTHGGSSACGDGGMTWTGLDGTVAHLVIRAADTVDNPHWEQPLVIGTDGQQAWLIVEPDDAGELVGFTVLDRFDNVIVTNRDLGTYANWTKEIGVRCDDCSYPPEDRIAWEAAAFDFGDVVVQPHTEGAVNTFSGLLTFRNIRARAWSITPDCPGGCEQPWEWLLYED